MIRWDFFGSPSSSGARGRSAAAMAWPV
uniref:Uncharacterized protein n=1 Tax=Arundo donax TaxID=35708 RepID=A0A0A9AEE1_ARUDO